MHRILIHLILVLCNTLLYYILYKLNCSYYSMIKIRPYSTCKWNKKIITMTFQYFCFFHMVDFFCKSNNSVTIQNLRLITTNLILVIYHFLLHYFIILCDTCLFHIHYNYQLYLMNTNNQLKNFFFDRHIETYRERSKLLIKENILKKKNYEIKYRYPVYVRK